MEMIPVRNVPVDIPLFLSHVVAPVGIDPVTDFETGEHRRNRDGVLRWKLTVLYQEPGRKKELVEISFAAPSAPEAEPGAQVVLSGLVARHWETTNEYGTNSGVTLAADTIGFQPAARNGANRTDTRQADAA
jgi:hypothetical protein